MNKSLPSIHNGFYIISSDKANILGDLVSNNIPRCFPLGFRHSNPLGLACINSKVDPTAAIIWDKSTNFFFYGDPSNSLFNSQFVDYFEKKIRPQQLQNPQPGSYTIHYESQWKSMIQKLFTDLMSDFRIHLTFPSQELSKSTSNNYAKNISLPEGYLLHQVDQEFLGKIASSWENYELVVDEIHGTWGSQSHYLEHSFGFCITYGQQIVALISSEANHDKMCEIGIKTDDSHQRKGLASALIQAFKNWTGFLHYTQIEWDCWKNNKNSFLLAKKMGFVDSPPYSVYFGWYHPIDHLIVNGYQNLAVHHDYQRAISFYKQVVSRHNQNGQYIASSYFISRSGIKGYFYNISACYAQLKDFTHAFTYFTEAIKLGWDNVGEFQKSPLFDEFRETTFGLQIIETLNGKEIKTNNT